MGIISVILLAIALAMDCFSISFTGGMVQPEVAWVRRGMMALSFGIFQAVMLLIGWLVGENFAQQIMSIDHWLAFGILLLLGIKMIAESLRPRTEGKGDTDYFSFASIMILSLATSIDALATGIIFVGEEKSRVCIAVLTVGLASFLFSLVGAYLGIYLKKKFIFKAEILGGIILIGIGTKILIEHLFF